jgi:hypothetical protein
MKQAIYAPNTVPTANIAVNKSRLKVYTNAGSMPTYYLQKGQEFQIEIANPTTNVILAKIILNGKAISQGGLVLNPGQRVFLDRYLDVAKKFLFDTYEVSGSEEMKAAIANNGDIKVEFYRERQVFANPYNTILTTSNSGPSWTTLGNYNSGTDPQHLRGSLTSSNGTGTYTTNGLASGIVGSAASFSDSMQNCSYTSSLDLGPTLDMMNNLSDEVKSSPLRSRSMSKSLKAKSVETGRVEMGSHSNQEFKYVNKTFEYSAFHTVEYKMLPVSQKINTIEDLNVKRYCTQCGAKSGKTDNFCASCGKKI